MAGSPSPSPEAPKKSVKLAETKTQSLTMRGKPINQGRAADSISAEIEKLCHSEVTILGLRERETL